VNRTATDSERDRLTKAAEELYERVPCGYVSAEADGTIVLANRSLAKMVGRPVDELIGRVRLQELLTTGGQIYFETHVSPLLLMQGHVEGVAMDVRGPDGAVPVLLNAEVRRDQNGKIIGIFASVLDATERRRYERELLAARNNAEEAVRHKRELIATISHDIRSPLSALSTVCDLLELTTLSEDQKNYLHILKTLTNHLAQLVNDVLDLSKFEAGSVQLNLKPVDLRQMIEDLVQEALVEADYKGLAFHVDIDPTLPQHLDADAIKLGRVLSNLMGNAVKFTDTGEVSIKVRLIQLDDAAAHVRFEIFDTGIGIEKEQLGRIFEDFAQGSDDIGSRYGGSGLGLGICKRFLALHDAELAIDSTPGEGSCFHFELVLAKSSIEVPRTELPRRHKRQQTSGTPETSREMSQ